MKIFNNTLFDRINRAYNEILTKIHPLTKPLEAGVSKVNKHLSFEQAVTLPYKPVKRNETWGTNWDIAWFKFETQIPGDWKKKVITANIDINAEGLVFNEQGSILQGITHGSVYDNDFSRDRILLFEKAEGGETVKLFIEGACHYITGITPDKYAEFPSQKERYGKHTGKLINAEISVWDTEAWGLINDLSCLRSLYKGLPEKSIRRARILHAMSAAIDIYASKPGNWKECRKPLKSALERPANASDLNISAVGHAHIDTAWLWPVHCTIGKCARTFANQLDLIKRYPGYIFGASQPQHYQFMKDHYPELFREIKRRVKEGRWELQGAMWVEADTNVPSGESLLRQCLHGKNFFYDEFGIEVKNLWLPDVFGYSAALPQILHECGVSYFLTQKISWNQFNEFPHNTFMWQGIDGSQILTHFPPENTYNSDLKPESLTAAQERFKENHFITEAISLFGIGDGGGGPKEEHLEHGLRLQNTEGSPKVSFAPAADFFKKIETYKPELEKWVGELYLELHRATYTAQARTKRLNRKLEAALRETEILWSYAATQNYPQEKINGVWKTLLLNQFHDILPGSSIHNVYQTTEKELTNGLQTCRHLKKIFADQFLNHHQKQATLLNTLSHTYNGLVTLPKGWNNAKTEDGRSLPALKINGQKRIWIKIPALTQIVIAEHKGKEQENSPLKESRILENALVRYEFNQKGHLIKGYDKEAKRDILPDREKGNLLSIYRDRPVKFDAWDIDHYYQREKTGESDGEVVLSGENQAGAFLKLNFRIGKSTGTQTIILASGHKRLDFETHINWQENHKMLRVSFPIDVHSNQASYEIQYGYITRPTHSNTSWEAAAFELSAHRYADISQTNYGAALLNDCKYGYKVKNNVLELSLLTASTYPDPDADTGEHQFTYSLYPHRGKMEESNVQQEARCLNQPPLILTGKPRSDMALPVHLKSEDVFLETFKKAEKEDCRIIRLVEHKGKDSSVTLKIQNGYKLVETNGLEWSNGNEYFGPEILLKFRPFVIKTFKVVSV